MQLPAEKVVSGWTQGREAPQPQEACRGQSRSWDSGLCGWRPGWTKSAGEGSWGSGHWGCRGGPGTRERGGILPTTPPAVCTTGDLSA